MKKRDLVLDFTSLLDILFIILFLTIASVGAQTANYKKETENAQKEAEKTARELENTKALLKDASADLEKASLELEKAKNDLADMQKKLAGLNPDTVEASQYNSFIAASDFLNVTFRSMSDGLALDISLNEDTRWQITLHYDEDPSKYRATLNHTFEEAINAADAGILTITLIYNDATLHRYEYQLVQTTIKQFRASSPKNIIINEYVSENM